MRGDSASRGRLAPRVLGSPGAESRERAGETTTDDMKTPLPTAGTLEPASATTWTRRGRCPAGGTRLFRHNNRPQSPGIGANSLHLSGGGVFQEPVERLATVGHLQGTAGPLDGAELRGAYAGARLRLGLGLGQQ